MRRDLTRARYPLFTTVAVAFALSCGGGYADAKTNAHAAAPTSAERTWTKKAVAYGSDLVQGLQTLEKLSTKPWRTGVAPRFKSAVFNKDSMAFAYFITSTGEILSCDKKLAKNVPRAPTVRLKRVRTLLVDACRSIGLGVTFVSQPMLLRQPVTAEDYRLFGQAMDDGADSLREAVQLLTRFGLG